MTSIIINSLRNGALINCFQIDTLKYIDKAPYFLKGPHKVLLEIRHGNRTAVLDTNGNSKFLKITLARLDTGVGCTSPSSDLQ